MVSLFDAFRENITTQGGAHLMTARLRLTHTSLIIDAASTWLNAKRNSDLNVAAASFICYAGCHEHLLSNIHSTRLHQRCPNRISSTTRKTTCFGKLCLEQVGNMILRRTDEDR